MKEFLGSFLQSAQYYPLWTSSLRRQNMVVWFPWEGLLVKKRQRGWMRLRRTPLNPLVIYLMSSVLTTPGCRNAVSPFPFPIFEARDAVKSPLHSLEREQARFSSQGDEVKFMSSKSILGSGPKPSSFLWARDETLMIRKKGDLLIFSQRRKVRQKCPRWLTAQCISLPSLVSLFSGMDMTPALLTRQSMWGKETALANDSMDYLSARSKWIYSIFLLLVSSVISLTASSDFLRSLAPKMMWHWSRAISRRVSLPMPVFAPVMSAYFPERERPLGMLKSPPLKYFLMKKRKTRRRMETATICQMEKPCRQASIIGNSDQQILIVLMKMK